MTGGVVTASRRPFKLRHYVVPENDLHQAVADALWRLLPAGAVMTTWELRNAASAIEGARRKRLHALPGWPDIGVFHDENVALLELKRSHGGALSPAQKALHPQLAAAGFPVAVCRSVDDALDAVTAAGIMLRGRLS